MERIFSPRVTGQNSALSACGIPASRKVCPHPSPRPSCDRPYGLSCWRSSLYMVFSSSCVRPSPFICPEGRAPRAVGEVDSQHARGGGGGGLHQNYTHCHGGTQDHAGKNFRATATMDTLFRNSALNSLCPASPLSFAGKTRPLPDRKTNLVRGSLQEARRTRTPSSSQAQPT